MLLPFQGAVFTCPLTQGVALGYMLAGLSGHYLADNNIFHVKMLYYHRSTIKLLVHPTNA